MNSKQTFHKVEITFDDGSKSVFENIQGRFEVCKNWVGSFKNPSRQWWDFRVLWIQPVSQDPVGKNEEPEPDKEINLYDF